MQKQTNKQKTASKQYKVEEGRIMSLSSASHIESPVGVREDNFNYFESNIVLFLCEFIFNF